MLDSVLSDSRSDSHAHRPLIGVGITTRNRPELLAETLRRWVDLAPGTYLVVVDDASTPPTPDLNVASNWFRFDENVGIAVAKNKCLELLAAAGCEHLFLADDDTWPTDADWWRPYVESPEPHLMYQFPDGPSHWATKQTATADGLTVWDKPRGCMLYADARILPNVGGMHTAFGKHGAEHGNWSDRIHAAGLTTHPYADVAMPPRFHCADQDTPGLSSVDFSQNTGWKHINPARLPSYAEYREQPVPVLVARREDGGHRDRLWRFLRETFWDQLPYRIVEGHHVEGPFNRSLGMNLAAQLAGNWDVALLVDSDAWVTPDRLATAISTARDTGRLVSCLTEVVELNQAATDKILAKIPGHPRPGEAERVRTADLETQSLALAVPRNLFNRVGGFDQGFVGWGGEDNAFWLACTKATGEPIRLEGPAWHLWHPPASREHQAANIRRLRRART